MRISDLESRELLPGTEARFVHSDRMTVAEWRFDPNIDLPEHSHPHDQITTIIEGEFELTVDGVPAGRVELPLYMRMITSAAMTGMSTASTTWGTRGNVATSPTCPPDSIPSAMRASTR